MSLRPGERFGRYEIVDLLGTGGMGAVYSAHDSILRRKVALKVLNAPAAPGVEATPHSGGASRILREARAAAGITHPNAVSIYDVGEVDGVPFLAMELVPGRSMRAFIGDSSVPLPRRLRWIVDVARALDAAHQLGLVHRDVKPDNVMIRDDGLVKVLDFGIARRAIETKAEDKPPVDLSALGPLAMTTGSMTAEGVVVGTPMYMAPEQLHGGQLDGRTDQFAWGVLAYELLSGRLPWEGSGAAILGAILSAEPRALVDVVPALPGPVDAAIRKSLSKAPDERFASMATAADEIERFAGSAAPSGQLARVSIPVPNLELAMTEQVVTGAPARTQREATVTGARRTGWAALTVGAVAVTAASVAMMARSPGTKPTGADAGPTAEAPSQMSTRPDATLAYEAGLQALHDGSLTDSVAQLRRAVEIDPLFGAAQLRLAIATLFDPSVTILTRKAFEEARRTQSSLGAHDRRVLQAYELATSTPPDFPAAQKLMKDAAETSGGSSDFFLQLAVLHSFAGEVPEAVAAFDDLLAKDPSFALAYDAKAQMLLFADDTTAVVQSLDTCLKVSPAATSCLLDRVQIGINLGQCDEVVASSKQLINRQPDSPFYYRYLAWGLAGQGSPTEAIRSVLRHEIELSPSEDQDFVRVFDDASLAALDGKLDEAARGYGNAEALVPTGAADDTRWSAAYSRAMLDTELGRPAEAARVANAYLRVRAGLPWNEYDRSLALDALMLANGTLSRANLEAARQQWLAAWTQQHGDTSVGSEWVEAYAVPTLTRDDARAALTRRPPTRPLLTLPHLDAYYAEALGRTHLLAGEWDQAARYLEMATRSCALLPAYLLVASQRASLELGQALEARGEATSACKIYALALKRWPSEARSRTMRTLNERISALACAR